MSDEWGPWQEHDGREAPHLEGLFVHVDTAGGRGGVGILIKASAPPIGYMNAWVWDSIPPWEWHDRVVRYRIRKPRALERLREIARNPERELEDA